MINFLSNNSSVLLLLIMQLTFCKKKYIPAIITNFAILLYYVFSKNILFCIELCAILSILFLIKHNNKFKLPQLSYIILISIAFLMIALKDLKYEWLINILKFMQDNFVLQLPTILLENIYIFILLFLLIGGTIFSHWSLYLFTISNNVFKIICFIVPMFLSLIFLNNQDAKSIKCYEVFGLIICLSCSFRMIIETNIRAIVALTIIFFYGLQILLLVQYNIKFIDFWLFIIFLMLLFTQIFTPNRTKNYSIKDLYAMCLNNRYKKILLTQVLIIFLVIYAYFFIICLNVNSLYYTVSVSSISLPICVIIVDLLSPGLNTHYKANTITNKTPLYISIQTVLLCLVVYKFIKNINNLHIPKLSYLLISIGILCCSILLAITLNLVSKKQNKKKVLKTNVFIKIVKFLKITFLIIRSAIYEFKETTKHSIIKISQSSLTYKLSNVLYDNTLYLYLFFFVQLIIILVVECIIL